MNRFTCCCVPTIIRLPIHQSNVEVNFQRNVQEKSNFYWRSLQCMEKIWPISSFESTWYCWITKRPPDGYIQATSDRFTQLISKQMTESFKLKSQPAPPTADSERLHKASPLHSLVWQKCVGSSLYYQTWLHLSYQTIIRQLARSFGPLETIPLTHRKDADIE